MNTYFIGKAFTALEAVLKSKLSANTTPAYVNSFLSPNSSGGLLGVYVASSSASDTEKAITFALNELKNIAGGSADYSAIKTTVNSFSIFFFFFSIQFLPHNFLILLLLVYIRKSLCS